MDDDTRETLDDFHEAVNMPATELEEWLETDESQSVGDTGGDGESTGHASGRRIVDLQRTNTATTTPTTTSHTCARSSATSTDTPRNVRRATSRTASGATR